MPASSAIPAASVGDPDTLCSRRVPLADTRDQIIHAAAELIWRQGYHNTSVDEIIRDAGICKGNFYYYFSSKEDLGLAVIDVWVQGYEEEVFAHAVADDRPPLRRLEDFLDATVQAQAENGFPGCPLGRMALEMGDLQESFRCRLDQAFDRFRRSLAGSLREAGLDAVDAGSLARFLLAATQGGFLLTKVERDGAVLQGVADQLKAQLRGRLLPAAATGRSP